MTKQSQFRNKLFYLLRMGCIDASWCRGDRGQHTVYGASIKIMRVAATLLFLCSGVLMADSAFDETQAARFAKLALDCVHKEYPNKIAHAMNSAADVRAPRE